MTTDSDDATTTIAEPAELRAHMGAVNPLAERKVLDRLDAHCRDFIALSPFLVLATADGEGRADASPRGDAPGFVEVVDERTLFIPDRRGNNRVDSFGNVLASPGVGLIFMVPGIAETLRVNGRATLTRDPDLLAPATVQERTPTLGLLVAVEEAFFHCGKALIRSKLWDPATRGRAQRVPVAGAHHGGSHQGGGGRGGRSQSRRGLSHAALLSAGQTLRSPGRWRNPGNESGRVSAGCASGSGRRRS